MPTKYLILRANRDVSSPAGAPAFGMQRESAGGPTELTVETADGHETDLGRLREDPRNAAVVDADVILSHIGPTSTGNGNPSFQVSGAVQVPIGIQAVGADTSRFSGQGVTVAVLDTGIDEKHPAFAGKTLLRRDFTGDGATPDDARDLDGHGTHCAGTICGAPVDGIRVGVAPGVNKLCVGKVIGKSGATMEMLVRAIFWAVVEQKAGVVSMSLSYDLPGNTARLISKGWDPALATNAALRQSGDLVRTLSTLRMFLESQDPNVVFAAATGNESKRPGFVLDAGQPAAEMLAVGAVGLEAGKWNVASFSNGRAHLVAPGVNVASAAPGGKWVLMSGTSMATPHVAGIAALWTEKLRAEGNLVPGAVASALKANAVRQPLATNDFNAIGAGMARAPQ